MKNIVTCLILFSSISFVKSGNNSAAKATFSRNPFQINNASGNLIIITIDGLRWHEIFNGAEESLINNIKYTKDTTILRMLYWADSEKERRQKLMPFFWSVLAQKGQLFGNRHFDNKVNTSNVYNVSYPGYNEMFTGNTDLLIHSNGKKRNVHQNVLEHLNRKEEFKGKVVAFTSWDVFPYILNEERSGLLVNSGYENMNENEDLDITQINKVQTEAGYNKEGPRYDELTFIMAREYLQQHRPKVVFIGLGETDEHAHHERYDLYLQQVNKIDRMLAELWQWIQTTPGYKDNTTILITTDHGRGNRKGTWASHGPFVRGSSETWLALMGPHLQQLGEIKQKQQIFQYQLAEMIAGLVGEEFAKGVVRKQ